jgi:uncharacterized protein YndB with AHSA1/START domain
MTPFKVIRGIAIKATPTKIWEALTNPKIIKKYLYGTQAESEWKVGSRIVYKGEYDGHSYADKGTIKQFEKGKIFQHSYLSTFSGIEDIPENYHLVTYLIEKSNGGSLLTINQENIHSKEAMEHAGKGWDAVTELIKEEAEKL